MHNKNDYSNSDQKCDTESCLPDISVCVEKQNTMEYYGEPHRAIRTNPYPVKDVSVYNLEEHPLEFSSLYDTMKENTKEKKIMSYVGILRSDKGIVAFSDSRSTYTDHGRQALESDDVKKVFVSKHFLFVTYGTNKVYHAQGKTERLEVVLDKLLKDFPGSHCDFFWELQKKLNLKSSNIQYHFIVGFKETDGNYGMEHCALSANGAQFSNLTYASGSITGGERGYGPMDLSFPPSMSIEKMKQLAKMTVTHAIEMGDLCLSYNPVGGPIQIEALV